LRQIKALILAGGFGTRLRPLSCARPKLLFPIAGRPMIEWVLDELLKNEVDTAILATNYLADMVKAHLGKKFDDIDLHYSLEDRPLGTGGAIKKAERFLKKDEDFFVLNSDIITSPPLKSIFQQHKSLRATATIMLHKVDDPTHFGVAQLGRSMKITKFIEKPRLRDAPSNWINAGIYILNPSIFSQLTPRTKISIEKEIFPGLASSGRLYGYKYFGEWFDIGRFEEYRRANIAVLSRASTSKAMIGPNVKVDANARLIPPLTIGPHSVVGTDVTLGPNTCVGGRSVINEGSQVSDSILFDTVSLGKNSLINGSLIGESAVVGANVRIGEGCVVGDNAVINDNLRLKNNVIICPYKEVTRSIHRPGIVT
jgi:mannose-1-phosphate guanylyltransferase/phosphomannomutase